MNKNWTLIKPRNDFFELRRTIENLQFAQRTYQMFGTRSPYLSDSDYSKTFSRLESVVIGEKDFVFWKPEELPYTKGQNVNNLEDAKKLWAIQVSSVISSMLYYIDLIKKDEAEFSTYPKWLRTRCEFACNQFMPLFKEYVRKDKDCGYLADRLFMPLNIKIPSRLP